MNFFRIDGPVFKWCTLLADLMALSIVWAICSIPLFTIGASTTALFYVTTRQVSHREGYVTRDFFKSFRQNFFRSTFVYIILLIPVILAVLNFSILNPLTRQNQYVMVFQIVLLGELAGVAIYIFFLIARFKLKMGQYFKNAFYFANRHISTTVTCLVFLCGAFWLFTKCEILIVILPGAYAYFASVMVMRVFRKYLPEMDRDSEQGFNEDRTSRIEINYIPPEPEKKTAPEETAPVEIPSPEEGSSEKDDKNDNIFEV